MNKAPLPPKGDPALYEKAVRLHKEAYKKEAWDSAKYSKKVGFHLRGIFRDNVWTLKDLNNTELLKIIELSVEKIEYNNSKVRHAKVL